LLRYGRDGDVALRRRPNQSSAIVPAKQSLPGVKL